MKSNMNMHLSAAAHRCERQFLTEFDIYGAERVSDMNIILVDELLKTMKDMKG